MTTMTMFLHLCRVILGKRALKLPGMPRFFLIKNVMTKSIFIISLFLASGALCLAQQKPDQQIAISEVERIEKVLASDEMQGRRAGSPEMICNWPETSYQ